MILLSRCIAGFLALGLAGIFLLLGLAQAQSSPPSEGAAAGQKLSSIQELFDQNRTAEALGAADQFEREHENPEALNQLAGVLAIHSQDERAAALFARVNQLRPHSAEVLYNLGVALYRCKQLDRAAAALAESADLDEGAPETHYSLALIASMRGEHENAILELQHAIKRAPRQTSYCDLLGQEFLKAGYWRGAEAAFRRASELEPSQAVQFSQLGDALFRLQDLDGAITAFQEAARLDPRLPRINSLIGLAYRKNGQLDQAGEFYKRQLMIDPDDLEALAGAGAVAVERSHFAEAEKLLHLALGRDPDHVEANYELGFLLFRTQRYEEAIEEFRRVLWLRPDHTQAEYYLYLTLSRSHQDAQAVSALANWKRLEAIDRRVRTEEVAYERAREARWKETTLDR